MGSLPGLNAGIPKILSGSVKVCPWQAESASEEWLLRHALSVRKLLLILPAFVLASCGGSSDVTYTYSSPEGQGSLSVSPVGQLKLKSCAECRTEISQLDSEQQERLQQRLDQADLGSLEKNYGTPSASSVRVSIASGGEKVTLYVPSGGPEVGIPPNLVSLEAELRSLSSK